MSRLDSMIRRLSAQRDILNHVADDLGLPETGDILEIGLGNGRTYSHLRERFPDRRAIAFDRADRAHKSSSPAPEDFVEGEIEYTARAFVGLEASLVHADIGQGYPERDAITLRWLPGLVADLLAPGGIAVSGLPLADRRLGPLPLPAGIAPDRYFLYRRSGPA
ncbi:MAG: class I SAM-dependent methyltransferase [Pseudomonadota bacterium]